MKKIISVLLVAVMFACTLAVNVSSAGVIYMDADFTNDATFSRDFYPEAFFTNDGKAVGYSNARAFQSVGAWSAYDVTFDVSFAEDELANPSEDRSLSFSYISENIVYKGLSEERLSISACFNITKSQITLETNGYSETDEPILLAGPVSFEFEDGKEYNFGVSVSENHIRVFHDSTLLMEYVDTNNLYYIAHTVEGVEPTILLWWNTGNTVSFSDVKVSSPEYLYPPMPGTTDNTEITTTTEAPAPITTTSKKVVDVTDKKGNAVTDDKGNKVTEEIVVTDAPVADTNTGAVQGGTSTSTGDSSLVVVCVMVAVLGCALIVRKVYAK